MDGNAPVAESQDQQDAPSQAPQEAPQGTDTSPVTPVAPPIPFIKRLFPNLPNFTFSVKSILIPTSIVFLVLLLGGGGTYLAASTLFNNSRDSHTSTISDANLPSSPIDNLIPSPTAAPSPTAIPQVTDEPSPTATPASTSALLSTTGWLNYSFGDVYLTFLYPPTWITHKAATSGAPYMYVQNFAYGSTPASSSGNFSIKISRLDQVGITTTDRLVTQLALNDVNDVYLNGIDVGKVAVLSAKTKTTNGYLSYERTIMYSASPSARFTELYVLDGKINAIRFFPQYDVTFGKPYLDTILSTLKFTN